MKGGGAAGLGDQHGEAEGGMPLGGGGLGLGSAGRTGHCEREAACGVPGGGGHRALEVGLAGDEAVGVLHSAGGVGFVEA